jgi:hypothetical protein
VRFNAHLFGQCNAARVLLDDFLRLAQFFEGNARMHVLGQLDEGLNRGILTFDKKFGRICVPGDHVHGRDLRFARDSYSLRLNLADLVGGGGDAQMLQDKFFGWLDQGDIEEL